MTLNEFSWLLLGFGIGFAVCGFTALAVFTRRKP